MHHSSQQFLDLECDLDGVIIPFLASLLMWSTDQSPNQHFHEIIQPGSESSGEIGGGGKSGRIFYSYSFQFVMINWIILFIFPFSLQDIYWSNVHIIVCSREHK